MISRAACLYTLSLTLWPMSTLAQVTVDPPGDLISLAPDQPDAIRMVAFEQEDRLEFLLRLAATEASQQLIIEIDQDGILSTGAVSWVSLLCPNLTGLGVELRIQSRSEANLVQLTDADGQVLAKGGARSFDAWTRLSLPLSAFGGAASGQSYAAVIGRDEASDCLPNSGSGVVTVQAWRYLGGQVKGLIGSGLMLDVQGSAPVSIESDGSFSFADPFTEGSAYEIRVISQPREPDQLCLVTNGSGTMASESIENVFIECGDRPDHVFEDRFELNK